MIHRINIHDRSMCNSLRTLLATPYPSVDPQTVGGRWYGKSDDGVLLACVWCAMDKPFAYVDYLASSTQRGHGLRLVAWLADALIANGYTRVLANVYADNKMMVRAITVLQSGRAPENGPYYLVDLTGGQ